MGEHRNNGKSLIKEELGIGKGSGNTVDPMDMASIMMITELARIGHTYLKQAVPDMKANIERGDSAITKDEYEHFKSLYEAGFAVLAHFDAICQYAHDAVVKSKNDSTGGIDESGVNG